MRRYNTFVDSYTDTFKVGMKVKCVMPDTRIDLSKGKVYRITRLDNLGACVWLGGITYAVSTGRLGPVTFNKDIIKLCVK